MHFFSLINRFLSDHQGYGTVIEQYEMTKWSCRLIQRWRSPTTCAMHEGIWCIRYHPNNDKLGIAIVNGQTNQWRFEIRDRKNFLPLFRINLPLIAGDCELSPLSNAEWLATNSCDVHLIHIVPEKIEAVVQYERELKNAIVIGNHYLVIRTKSSLDIHPLNSIK
jgi:hypothetical protein